MPVILRLKGYTFFFVMYDLNEPMHIHVRRGRNEAKYWMNPLALAWSKGYREHELNQIERLIEKNREKIERVWRREQGKDQ